MSAAKTARVWQRPVLTESTAAPPGLRKTFFKISFRKGVLPRRQQQNCLQVEIYDATTKTDEERGKPFWATSLRAARYNSANRNISKSSST
jgi:hypothetical protein